MIEYLQQRGKSIGVTVRKDSSGRITVSFPYDPKLVAKAGWSLKKCFSQ